MIENLSKGSLSNEPIEVCNTLNRIRISLSISSVYKVTAERLQIANDAIKKTAPISIRSKDLLEASTIIGSGLIGISLGLGIDIFAGRITVFSLPRNRTFLMYKTLNIKF